MQVGKGWAVDIKEKWKVSSIYSKIKKYLYFVLYTKFPDKNTGDSLKFKFQTKKITFFKCISMSHAEGGVKMVEE